jgi:hypothetical protein
MNRVLAALALVALGVVLVAVPASAATVYLKDGRKIEGEVVKTTDLEVRVKKADGKTVILRQSEIERIDDAPPAASGPVSRETGDVPVDKRTQEYERWIGFDLPTVLTELTVVRGDHPAAELKREADFAEKTARHFLATFGCAATDVLKGAYGPGRIEIFQFQKEEGYLAFCDKVLDRIRDETVDDKRLAFMRRQRGFWVVSPRVIVSQYQGPSDFTTVVSAACHKVSHEMLTLWKPTGSFVPWWLYEGLATWQEFAVLGETRTYCIEIARPGDYAKAGTPEADEAAKARLEKSWRTKVKSMVAGRSEKDLAMLGKMSLNELVLEDVQQSWSVVDWLNQQGKLKDFVVAYKDKRDLSAAFQAVIGVPTSAAHEAWRAWVLKTY